MPDPAPCPDCGSPGDGSRGYCRHCYYLRRAAGEFEHARHPYVDVSWHEDALCASVGDDLWFPEKGESPKEAMKICRSCPVRAECLDYALTWRQNFGVWGALTERGRRDLVKALGLDIVGDAA